MTDFGFSCFSFLNVAAATVNGRLNLNLLSEVGYTIFLFYGERHDDKVNAYEDLRVRLFVKLFASKNKGLSSALRTIMRMRSIANAAIKSAPKRPKPTESTHGGELDKVDMNQGQEMEDAVDFFVGITRSLKKGKGRQMRYSLPPLSFSQYNVKGTPVRSRRSRQFSLFGQ
ncbi:hypothetical protein COLO4_06441 [Corchorus olitorius]|uniref:Uncharacterized protein n=1 Tax=Corchorus olitorius TaxID=93759 RepID=A0A1R3KN29_9ROSI|nr:hypothetical protein COLO4_06441 [Corchorus olitorius]